MSRSSEGTKCNLLQYRYVSHTVVRISTMERFRDLKLNVSCKDTVRVLLFITQKVVAIDIISACCKDNSKYCISKIYRFIG